MSKTFKLLLLLLLILAVCLELGAIKIKYFEKYVPYRLEILNLRFMRQSLMWMILTVKVLTWALLYTVKNTFNYI